jgi:hypothetical protein
MPLEEAQQNKARASLRYDESGLPLEGAQLDAQEARFNENVAGEAPGPGLVRYTMPDGLVRFVSPDEADQLDFQHGLTRSQNEYPARYAQQQQQAGYAAQQQNQGDPFAGVSDEAVLNMLPTYPSAITPPGQPSRQTIVASLKQRYIQKYHLTPDQAEAAANVRIQQELESRKAKAAGTPQLEVGPDGKLRVKQQ